MRVVIAGGGPGGRAAAAVLSRANGVRDVTLLSGSANGAFKSGVNRFPVGLWNGGLACLEEAGVLERLQQEEAGKFVSKAAYLSVGGDRLAWPSPLGHDLEHTSLLFVRSNSLLLDALRDAANPSVVKEEETHLAAFEDTGKAVCVTTTDREGKPGRLIEADLLIGADGVRSTVARLLDSSNPPQFRGYRVFRGTSLKTWSEESFQTWDPAARFASVPIPGGQVWYAAVPSQPAEPLSRTVTPHEFQELQQLFLGWHEPVPLILDATSPHLVHVQDAVGSPLQRLRSSIGRGRVALIGDAAFCLDPILALGASVAMEDALKLSRLLADRDPSDAVKAFAKHKRKRALLLAITSNCSQWVGMMHPSALASARNGVMRILPSTVKTAAFDRLTRLVAGP